MHASSSAPRAKVETEKARLNLSKDSFVGYLELIHLKLLCVFGFGGSKCTGFLLIPLADPLGSPDLLGVTHQGV